VCPLPSHRYAADLHRYVLRVLGSRFEPAVVADELHVAELLKSRLAHEGRHDDAIRMATLLRKLSASQTLSREWATLFLLHRLAGTPSQLAYQASTAPLTGRGAAAFHSEGLARVHDAGTTPAAGSAAQASEAAAAARVRRMQAGGGGGGLGTAAAGRPRGRTEWGAGAGATADGGGGGAAEEAPPPPPRPGFAEYKQVVNTSFDVGEPALLRDMIYVLQVLTPLWKGRVAAGGRGGVEEEGAARSLPGYALAWPTLAGCACVARVVPAPHNHRGGRCLLCACCAHRRASTASTCATRAVPMASWWTPLWVCRAPRGTSATRWQSWVGSSGASGTSSARVSTICSWGASRRGCARRCRSATHRQSWGEGGRGEFSSARC
jgi:hypothetical protein